MNAAMYRILTLVFLAVSAFNVFAQSSHLLFRIERTTNKNKVYYEAKQNKNGTLDTKTPVHAYWIMWEKDPTGKSREDLNAVEKKMAFGFKIEPGSGPQQLTMKLVSCPKQPIDVYLQKGKAVARMTINGKPAILDKIFISSQETILLPKVNYLELFGKDAVTGQSRYEKVIP
jgi:hypothetical protein